MSISANKYFGEGEEAYTAMAKALDSGERIVYDTNSRRFAHVSSDEAKELAKNPRFVTDLTQLKARIENYVQEKGISEASKQQLDKAFDRRAERLAGRFVLFGGSKRDAAVENLKEIPKAINAAARRFKPVSSEPPKSHKPAGGIPLPGMASQESLSKAGQAVEPSVGDDIFGEPEGPPPPPVGGPGAPPPPPPPGLGKPKVPQKSFTHRTLTAETKRFTGEPEAPKLKGDYDLGKPSTIPQGEKDRLTSEIDTYLYGTLETVPAKGKFDKPKEVRKSNGLDATIKKIKPQIARYDAIIESQKGTKVKLLASRASIQKFQSTIADLKKKEEANQMHSLELKTKDSVIQVPFFTQSQVDAARAKFDQASEPEKKELAKLGLDPAHMRTIGWKIEDLKAKVAEEEEAIREYEQSLRASDQELATLSALKENGIPFSEWKTLLETKENQFNTWKTTLESFSKAASSRPVPEKTAVEDPTSELKATNPELSHLLKLREQLGQENLGSYMRNPDVFYGRAE